MWVLKAQETIDVCSFQVPSDAAVSDGVGIFHTRFTECESEDGIPGI